MNGQSQTKSIAHDQNYLQLMSIQSVSLGLPVITVGNQLAEKHGTGVAICSILIGNLILWIISITIISMAFNDRNNAIQNAKKYLGKYGSLFMWAVLIVIFVNWFALQIDYSTAIISTYFRDDQQGILVRLGAGIGFLTTLLSVGGIRLIKWIATVSLPVIVCYYLYAITHSNYIFLSIENWGISYYAVITSVLLLLPGVVNLPTFFRHSRSRADCYLALSIMTVFISFFEVSTIWMKFINNNYSVFSVFTLCFVVLTLICSNLRNIYFAAACWEGFFPHFEGARGYAIIGLLGTVFYTFVQIASPILFLGNLANCFIASLGIVLLISFLVGCMVRHRPRSMEKTINSVCWLIGCVVSTVLTIQSESGSVYPLLAGIGASVVTFACIFFVEEEIWAIQQIITNK